MTDHIYTDMPDARLNPTIKEASRFAPRYRALTAEELILHDQIKAKAAELEALFNQVLQLRYASQIITAPEGQVSAEQLAKLRAEWAKGRRTTSRVAAGDISREAGIIDIDYSYEGMKALEMAVIWTIKGLTK